MRILKLFCLTFLLSGGAVAETYRVNASQSDQVQSVLDRTVSGDVVIFERGTYRTQRALVLNGKSNVELRGSGRVEIVLNNLDEAVIEVRESQNIRIQGLRARHEKPNPEYACEGAVIAVFDSQQIGISRNHLNGCGAAGVYSRGVKDLVVFDNKIFNNSFAGVWTADTTGYIYKNHLYKNAADFISYGECDIVLSGNKIEKNEGNDYSRSEFVESIVRGR